MKTIFCVFFLLCAASAFGQVGVSSSINAEVQPLYLPDHAAHASQHDMRPEQDLYSAPSVSYAKGERPLWEFGEISHPTPLGDIARAYRKEHLAARKAELVLEKQY